MPVNANQLLDPAYDVFRNDPNSEWTLAQLPAIRARIDASFKTPDEARCEQHWIPASPAGPGIRLCLYRPWAEGAQMPAILYIHGGGFVLGRPEMADDYLAQLCEQLQAVIVAVDYRLAPEHPFPLPLEDCYIALGWVFEQSAALRLDRRRIAVMGHSAGGGLAAALALLARDKGEYDLAGLVMAYPMLDHRTGSPASIQENPTTGTFSWLRDANRFCWECLQGSYEVDDDQAPYFSPALAENLSGLPRTFLGVGALDLFLEEDVAFALKLSRAGVPVELHVYPGVPHMFDQYPGALTDQAQRDTLSALQAILAVAQTS